MSDFNRGVWGQAPARADMSVDAGLRAFMLGVYNKMALGLALSAVLAWVTSHAPVVQYLFVQDQLGRVVPTPAGTALMWAPLAVVLIGSFLARGITVRNSGAYYWIVVSLLGAANSDPLHRFEIRSDALLGNVAVDPVPPDLRLCGRRRIVRQ